MKASLAVTEDLAVTTTEIADAPGPDLGTADVEDLHLETVATDQDLEIAEIDPGTDPDLGMQEDVGIDPAPEIVTDLATVNVLNHQDLAAEVKMKTK